MTLKNKKDTFQKVWKACRPYVLTALPFVLMDVFIRILAGEVNYSHVRAIAPSIIFSVLWIGMIVCATINLPKTAGRIVYGVLFGIFFLLFLTNSVYFSYTDFFFSFHLMSLAGDGSDYIWSTVAGASPWIYVFALVVLATASFVIVRFPTRKKHRSRMLLLTVLIFLLLHTLTPLLYGKAYDQLKWDAWRNPRNVYNNFNDTNKSVKICGLYEYIFRDFYKAVFDAEPEKTPEEEQFLEEVFDEDPVHADNPYSGMFEGKNVIFLQLEGIDSWLLTQEDMPNLYQLQQESINFTQHYSYYTGGGSTFNSELAVNTGFVTSVTYYQNAYTLTSNLYPHSLPKVFKNLGYSVNAFHMNTGEYYSRKLNYLNWGYDNYYGLLDVAEFEDESYELDRELILNETFHDAMFLQEEPFLHYIITYTPHTPFVATEGKGLLLAQEKYGEEEIPELGEEECARLYASETDRMVGLLMEELKEHELLENTVIVAFADHYLYTLNDKTILENNGKITENNLINHTPFFIWSADLQPETIDKVNSQIDILPTVLNLFGIEHEEQHHIGCDIFSRNYSGYVFFSDYSWYDGNLYVANGEVLCGEATDSAYIIDMSAMVSSLILKNDLIQKYDYFREMEEPIS